jgi:hypothetical protein
MKLWWNRDSALTLLQTLANPNFYQVGQVQIDDFENPIGATFVVSSGLAGISFNFSRDVGGVIRVDQVKVFYSESGDLGQLFASSTDKQLPESKLVFNSDDINFQGYELPPNVRLSLTSVRDNLISPLNTSILGLTDILLSQEINDALEVLESEMDPLLPQI